MGGEESHFNASLIVRDKVIRQCAQTTTFEEREELKWNQTEVLLFTSLTAHGWAKLATMGRGYLFSIIFYCPPPPDTVGNGAMLAGSTR